MSDVKIKSVEEADKDVEVCAIKDGLVLFQGMTRLQFLRVTSYLKDRLFENEDTPDDDY